MTALSLAMNGLIFLTEAQPINYRSPVFFLNPKMYVLSFPSLILQFFFIACISVVLTTCSMQFIINPMVRAVGFPKSPTLIRDMKCPGKAIWIYGMAAVWGNKRSSYIGGQILNDKLSASAILSCSTRVEAHILLKRMEGPIYSSIKTKHKSQLLAWNREGKRKKLTGVYIETEAPLFADNSPRSAYN